MDTMQYTHLYRSPLGTITLAADSEGLTGLWFEGQKYFAATLDAQHEETMLPIFEQTRRWLDNYFGGNVGMVNLLPNDAESLEAVPYFGHKGVDT